MNDPDAAGEEITVEPAAEPESAEPETAPPEPDRDGRGEAGVEARVHDFTRSEALPRAVVQGLERVRSSFARAAAAGLSASLRASVQITPAGFTQETYDQYVQSAPDPSVIAAFSLRPLPGRGLLQLDLNIARWMMDHLLGGKGDADPVQRPLTDVEKALLEVPVSRMLAELGTACENLARFQPELTEISGSIRSAEVAKPMEAMAVLSFQVEIDSLEGRANVCLPALSLKLGAAGEAGPGEEAADARSLRERLAERLRPVPVSCVVRLGRVSVTAAQLACLQEGDVLFLDRAAGAELEVLISGKPRFMCRPMRREGKVSVSIVGDA